MRRRDAAHQLALTERQTQRLMNRFRESGAAGLSNLRRGRPGNHRLPDIVNLVHWVWLAVVAENLAIISCLLLMPDTHSTQSASAIPTLGRRWHVRNSQNCRMSICPKKMSGRLWLKPVSGSPANNEHQSYSAGARYATKAPRAG